MQDILTAAQWQRLEALAMQEHHEHTFDGTRHLVHYAVQALEASSGEAVLEIGVRLGHTSAVLSELLEMRGRDKGIVIGVDPYGSVPYTMLTTTWESSPYDASMYIASKARLSPYKNHYLFVEESRQFFAHAENFTWFIDGERYPKTSSYIAFAFLDGQHNDDVVMQELVAVQALMAPFGIIVIDDADCAMQSMSQFHAQYCSGDNSTFLCLDHEIDRSAIQWPGRPLRAIYQRKGG